MIAGRLTMRAVVERYQSPGKDAWGGDLPGAWVVIDVLRCFAWSNASREIVDGDKTAMIEDMRVLFALGADISEDDEISVITDRAGNVVVPGRLKVEGPVQHKHTHLEAALKRIG